MCIITIGRLAAIGRDHIAVDDGVGGIGGDKADRGKQVDERQDDGDDALRHKGDDEQDVDGDEQNNAERRQQIPLESQRREDERVLEHLTDLHIKGDEHQIDIGAHDDVQDGDRGQDPEHHVKPEGTDRLRVISDVDGQNDDQDAVDQTEQEALLEVALDAVEIIAEYKYRLAAHKTAQNVERADRLQSQRQQQEDDTRSDDPIGCGGVDGDIQGKRLKPQEKIGRSARFDQRRTIQRCKGSRALRRCHWRGQKRKDRKNDGNDLQQHQHVEAEQM